MYVLLAFGRFKITIYVLVLQMSVLDLTWVLEGGKLRGNLQMNNTSARKTIIRKRNYQVPCLTFSHSSLFTR